MEMKKCKFISANEYCVRVFDGTHDSPKPCEKGYKLLTSKNILAGELDKTSAYYISENDYNDINQRSKVQQYDILFSMIGSVGNVCFVKDSNIDFAIKNMGVFSCENKEKALYLYYYLQSPFAKKMIDSYLNGAVQKFLGLERLRNFPILEYSTDKQKIAAVLSSLDDKIALNKKINAKLEAMAKRLYDYWFVQFDYPDKNGKPYKTSGGKMVWNEVLKREIPEGWEVGKIGDLFESQAGFAFNSAKWTETGHPVLTIKNIHSDGTISFDNTSFIESYDDKLEKYTVNNGNMIFAMSGNTIGKVGIISSSIENVLINQRVLIIKSSTSDIAFSYFIVSNPNVQNLVFQLGANSAQPNISEDEFRKIKICIPNKQFISKFNFQLKSFFDEVISNRIQIQKLTNLRDRLLPLLMNGQVEVEG